MRSILASAGLFVLIFTFSCADSPSNQYYEDETKDDSEDILNQFLGTMESEGLSAACAFIEEICTTLGGRACDIHKQHCVSSGADQSPVDAGTSPQEPDEGTNQNDQSLSIDKVISVKAPDKVKPGEKIALSIEYSATAQRDIVVYFQRDTAPNTGYGSARKTVSKGAGTAQLSVTIDIGTPGATDEYQFQVVITTVGGNWDDRFDNLSQKNVDCIAEPTTKSCVKEVLNAGKYASPVWLSDTFSGTFCRTVYGNFDRMVVEINANNGGFDTAVRRNYTNTPVDDISGPKPVHTNVAVQSVSGSGSWWIGPKISVYKKGTSSLDGNYENYVMENASKTPAEYHKYFTSKGKYLGETQLAGSTYKHYVFAHKTWWQYRAIRQQYRESGTVDVKAILDTWRGYGMPNYELRGIRAGNIETGGDIKATFVISEIETPEAL